MTTYTLKQFVNDLDAITAEEGDPAVITAKAAPLLRRCARAPTPSRPSAGRRPRGSAAATCSIAPRASTSRP